MWDIIKMTDNYISDEQRQRIDAGCGYILLGWMTLVGVGLLVFVVRGC